MLTDLKSPSMRIALQQIYVNLYVEYGRLFPIQLYVSRVCILMSLGTVTVVKNPLSPVEHPGGVGVNNELFEESLEQFVVSTITGIGGLTFLTGVNRLGFFLDAPQYVVSIYSSVLS